jgi:hypothetical protein
MHRKGEPTEPKLEGGSVRADGTVRKVVKIKAGWTGELEQQQYKSRGPLRF